MDNDTLTEAGAHFLARAIRAYWLDRGHSVAVRVEYVPGTRVDTGHYAVRSDLLDGMPRAGSTALAKAA